MTAASSAEASETWEDAYSAVYGWDTDPCVVVAHGWNIRLRVKDGHLVVTDGIGGRVRERK